MAGKIDPRFAGTRFAWSGLQSDDIYKWQHGLREVARSIGDMLFIPSSDTGSGYEHWQDVARTAVYRGHKALLLMGHSNGGYAITSIAKAVQPHGIKCWLISWDRTLKPCPPMGDNVERAIDIHAGLQKLDAGPDFDGEYIYCDYRPETHTGVINNKEAKDRAVAFGREFVERYG